MRVHDEILGNIHVGDLEKVLNCFSGFNTKTKVGVCNSIMTKLWGEGGAVNTLPGWYAVNNVRHA